MGHKLRFIICIFIINIGIIIFSYLQLPSNTISSYIHKSQFDIRTIIISIPGFFQSESLMSGARQRLQLFSNQLKTSSTDRLPYVVASGSKFTEDYRVYYKNEKTAKIGSFFHDVDFNLNCDKKTVNMIVEIPRWTNAKMEITKELTLNPITQDTKKGKLRFIHNIYPFHGYIHNYGAIPQTWEDCSIRDSEVEDLYGDNDPIDVCDLGSPQTQLGEIVPVKILGALALIDDGELDWKVIAINLNDPISKNLNDIVDVERYMPGVLESTRNWFRDYKIPEDKQKNKFAFNGEYKNSDFALQIIKKTHNSWKKLISGKIKEKGIPLIENTSQSNTPGYTKNKEIIIKSEEAVSKVPSSVNDVFHLP